MSSPTEIKFGTDGWRAIIGDEFILENVRKVALGVAKYLKENSKNNSSIVIGYDTRFLSENFATSVAEIISSYGINIKLFSKPSITPACSFSVVDGNHTLGLMITASHNSKEWNGIKIKSSNGGSAEVKVVNEIEKNINNFTSDFTTHKHSNSSKIETFNPNENYIKSIKQIINLEHIKTQNIKVIVDNMHGSGSGIIKTILSGGNIIINEIRSDNNPDFPGMNQPEPIEENLKPLSKAVLQQKANLGIALDGDGDRLGIIDETGKYITTLEVFSLLTNYLSNQQNNKSGIACTITMSSMIDKLGEKNNIPVYRTPVGFKHVGPIMKRYSCFIGGEESGGYAFKEHIPERDGVLSGLLFLQALTSNKQKISELISNLYSKFGTHIYKRVDKKKSAESIKSLSEKINKISPKSISGLSISSIDRQDGVKFFLSDGSWIVLRISGTEPLVRIYAESDDEEKLNSIINESIKIFDI